MSKGIKRSSICVLALLIFISGILTACSESEDTTTEPTATETQQGGGDETVTLTAIFNYNNPMTNDPQDMPSIQEAMRETNVSIDWEVIRSGWEDRKNLVLASGDVPDMFFGNRTLNMSDIMGNLDLFVELSDLIDSSVNINRMFSEEPLMLGLSSLPDGTIYSLPHRMPLRPDTFDGMYINNKWLDAGGLAVPSNLDEFYDALVFFRDGDPNETGQADTIPYSFAGTGTMFGTWWIFGSFGLADNIWGEKIEIRNGELLFTPIEDGFRDGLKYLRMLYVDGLMDQEVFTQDWSQWTSKTNSTDPQIIGVAGMWTIETLFGVANAPDYVVLPPLEGYNGERRWRSNPTNLRSNPATWSMTKACENPDAAWRFIEYLYDPEVSVQFYFGSYGVGIEKLDDGRIDILPADDPDKSYDAWLWENSWGDMGPYYVSGTFEETINPNSWVQEKLEIDAVYQPYLPDEIFPTMNYTKEISDELAILRTDIDSIINDRFATWVSGQGDIDQEWQTYLDQLNSAGLPRLMEIYETAYEAFKAN